MSQLGPTAAFQQDGQVTSRNFANFKLNSFLFGKILENGDRKPMHLGF